jgi:hypothetical protein
MRQEQPACFAVRLLWATQSFRAWAIHSIARAPELLRGRVLQELDHVPVRRKIFLSLPMEEESSIFPAGGGGRTRTELALPGILSYVQLPVTRCNHWMFDAADAKLCKILCKSQGHPIDAKELLVGFVGRLTAQLVEQRLGVFQVGGVEAFGEPVVDFRQHRARFVAMTLLREQSREAGRGAQFK